MLTDRFLDALAWSFQLHQYQSRKSTGIPYFSHLMTVAALVMEADCTQISLTKLLSIDDYLSMENIAIAALLHDAVEDQGGLDVANQMRVRFGDQVTDIVMLCSDSTTVGDKSPWKQRKQHHIDMLKSWDSDNLTPTQRGAVMVMTADKLHNARATHADMLIQGDKAFANFRTGKVGTLWYLASMCSELMRLSQNSSQSVELAEIITSMSDQECLEDVISVNAPLVPND